MGDEFLFFKRHTLGSRDSEIPDKIFFLALKIVNCLCRIFFSLYTAYRVGIGI